MPTEADTLLAETKKTLIQPNQPVVTASDMIRTLSLSLVLLSLIAITLSSGCTPLQNRKRTDFTGFTDGAIPAADQQWLSASQQSQLTERISQEAGTIHGQNRREKVYRVMSHVWEQFKFDRWDNERMFTRSADDLFRERTLGGCADYALVLVTFFRALEIPARMVVTANVNWIKAYQANPLSMPEGHVFVEAFLEERWALVDPTFRLLYSDHNPAQTSYPGEQLYCLRGPDYWEMGLHKVTHLQRTMAECASRYRPEGYSPPATPAESL